MFLFFQNNKCITLVLNGTNDDTSFTLNADFHWMGSIRKKWFLRGTFYRQNNYYFLSSTKAKVCSLESTGNIIEKEQIIEREFCFDFIVMLNSVSVLSVRDKECEILMGNCGIMNNEEFSFNAFLSHNYSRSVDHRYGPEAIDENNDIKQFCHVLDGIKFVCCDDNEKMLIKESF